MVETKEGDAPEFTEEDVSLNSFQLMIKSIYRSKQQKKLMLKRTTMKYQALLRALTITQSRKLIEG